MPTRETIYCLHFSDSSYHRFRRFIGAIAGSILTWYLQRRWTHDGSQRRSRLFLRVFVQSGSRYLNLANGLDDAVNFRLRECGSASIGLLKKDKIDASVIGK